jgi:hypothetical protein
MILLLMLSPHFCACARVGLQALSEEFWFCVLQDICTGDSKREDLVLVKRRK